jgi:formylglycine-generating enzyme
VSQEERYTDWKEIGRGGFGAVYKAYDQMLKRGVAIKLLKEELVANASLVQGLHQEVIISRDLRHENICPIHDVYQGPRGVGTVMDLIDGDELTNWMAANKGQLLATAPQRLELLRKLAHALAFAHTRIVHRDIKPDNIFLSKGDPSRPIIMDFGASDVGITSGGDGMVAGTPRYMSPEQWEAPDKVDQRSDLFSLGILAYELLTDKLPPTSLRRIQKIKVPPRINMADIARPSSFCVALPNSLDRLILQMMNYEQDGRPQTAQAVAEFLDAVQLKDVDTAGLGDETVETQLIPSGSYHIGSRGGKGAAHERPVRQVHISSFRMSVFPVTVRQYRTFIAKTGYTPSPMMDDPVFGRPEHPIVGVSFHDAMAYAKWVGGDLPTEAQWEYAAKGGAKFPQFPWGDTPPSSESANIDSVSTSTSPVDSCLMGKNPFGLFDLCGNVWEWCKDSWDPGFYSSLKRGDTDPFNDKPDGDRALRGGGFDSFTAQGRCASRFHASSDIQSRSIGFRVVFSVEG